MDKGPLAPIETARLFLVPATAELARLELADRTRFSEALGADVPESWPPAILADARPLFLSLLEADPARVGWLGWYGIRRAEGRAGRCLIGSAGFKGPPTLEGSIEVGYSVLPEFEGNGYATEMVAGLLRWAGLRGVGCVLARTTPENRGSIRVLEKLGFTRIGSGPEPESLLFSIAPPMESDA